jgi:hypothetical protein
MLKRDLKVDNPVGFDERTAGSAVLSAQFDVCKCDAASLCPELRTEVGECIVRRIDGRKHPPSIGAPSQVISDYDALALIPIE